jgi:hypothetical protein
LPKNISWTILAKQVMWTPQFVFGIILVSAWLIFLVIPFLIFRGLTIDQYLIAVERISTIIAVAVGIHMGSLLWSKKLRRIRENVEGLCNSITR